MMFLYGWFISVIGVIAGLTASGDLPLALGIVLAVLALFGAVLTMGAVTNAYEEDIALASQQGTDEPTPTDESPERDC